jgi:hypothetical protein
MKELIMNKILTFGKNRGKKLATCEESYLRWLASHEKVLGVDNRWASRIAKQLLLKKEEKPVNVDKVQILDIMDNSIEIRAVRAICPKCVKVDPSIMEEIRQNFRSGQIAEVSIDDQNIVRKVEAA